MASPRLRLLTAVAVLAVLAGIAPRPCAARDPGTLMIDVPAEFFRGGDKRKGPVEFDHSRHVGRAEPGCSVCHHTSDGAGLRGGGEPPSCAGRRCHGATRSVSGGKRVPDVEDAFHENCKACHKRSRGPLHCGDCHGTAGPGDDAGCGWLGGDWSLILTPTTTTPGTFGLPAAPATRIRTTMTLEGDTLTVMGRRFQGDLACTLTSFIFEGEAAQQVPDCDGYPEIRVSGGRANKDSLAVSFTTDVCGEGPDEEATYRGEARRR